MGILLSKDYEYIEIKQKSEASSTSILSAIIFLAVILLFLISSLFRRGSIDKEESTAESRKWKRPAGIEIQMATFESDVYVAEREPNPHFISSGLKSPLLTPQK